MKTNLNPPATKSGLVLVVDDEAPNRMLLRDSLESHGYEVREAEDGLQALEQIAAALPDAILLDAILLDAILLDAILLDVMMPRMHGFELCQRLKQNPLTASIPILMVTALGERHERLMGIKVGANDFITKPVDLQDAVLRVGNAVKLKHLYDRLAAEQKRSEQLLHNMLPDAVAQRMKAGETTIADLHPEATVLFADLVGFTTLSAHIGAGEVVYLLDEIFSNFDAKVEARGLEKIKTVGDGYLVVGGAPAARTDHALAVVELALDMRKAIHEFNQQCNTSIQVRFGICSGPVVAGVIGRKKFSYDIWGQTVNHACRLATLGEGGSIWIAPSTCELVQDRFDVNQSQPEMADGHGDFCGYKLGLRLPNRARSQEMCSRS